ncbi:multiple sugar transport system permease protein [Streptosporangium becharense]|uniref:Multiple sugar transport system permease protein n=1 Tax=Streptosporangium becharense TaxID=1816182 RepID=A0A7W9IB51_9ACTN|nr:sugar ABC transporter permease [Streptosporangium becharense]MBB2910797.1 multiple sugar transport system permease protein [Streptosporangium becharense]MBB5817492.1 multiple sugar transport system permease protein [Streptosporangium becharense]
MSVTLDRPPREIARGSTPSPPPWWRGRKAQGWLYATPTALIVGVLFVVPLILVVWMSLHRWPLLGGATFNAPDNYTKITDNPLFLDSVFFTLKYTVIVTVLLSATALGLALLVQERRPGVGFFRTAFFLPGAVGFAAAALLFYGMLNNDFGPIDPILQTLGITDEPVKWIGSPDAALFSTIALVLWRFAGFNMLILLTGLQAIPVEVYEAARSDGANRWQIFTRITLPLLRPTIALMLILSVTGSLLAFDQFFIFTNGGPDNSTVSMVMVVYREAFFRFDLGGAAAISVVLLLALVALNVLQMRVLRRSQ